MKHQRVLRLTLSASALLQINFVLKLGTVVPRYNAVVGVHEMEPLCKRGAL